MGERDHTWLLFDSGACHPHENMAMDEALLDLAHGHSVVLRFYDWSPPGLSLGYFQKYDESPAVQADAYGAVVTRRGTGGGAILHKDEITFSIAGDEGREPFGGTVEASYHTIHRAVAAGLDLLGIKAALRADLSDDQGNEAEAGWCFYRVTEYDLVAGGRKLVGSAQRRRNGRVCHHGSIPLDTNMMTPKAASIRDLAGKDITREEAMAVLLAGFERNYGVRFKKWQPGSEIISEASRIHREKYATEEWLRRW